MTRIDHLPLLALASSLWAVTGGCGGGGADTDDGPTTFECLELVCDAAAGEFCLFERYASTNEPHAAVCVQPATPCTTCECAEEAAYAHFDGASNCDGWIACTQTDGAITVECTNPYM